MRRLQSQGRYKIDELAELTASFGNRQRIYVMLQAYLDESGIHDDSAVCVVAGYFGARVPMRKLERAWVSTLRSFNFPMEKFHAKKLVGSPKYDALLRALSLAVKKQRHVYPVSQGIIVNDFFSFSLEQRRFMTGATLRKDRLDSSGCPSKPYFIPFQNVLRIATERTPVGEKANFFFGLDRTFSGYAKTLFAQIERQNNVVRESWQRWESRDRLGIPAFPLAAKTPQLQAADMLAHLTYLHMSQWVKDGRVKRPSELLSNCLASARSRSDHQYQDKQCLEKMLAESRKIAGNWDG